jgi:hypothetical protein
MNNVGNGEGNVKSFVVVLSALVLLLIAAAHGYRAYAHIDVEVAKHAIPILASWICAGVTGLLGLLLLVVRK